jgi:uncharacterized membrane protein YccC
LLRVIVSACCSRLLDAHVGFFLLQGTAIGAIVGYVIAVLTGDGRGARATGVALLFLWVLAGGLVRADAASPRSYAGLVAAFTAPIIVIGRPDEDDGAGGAGGGAGGYALARIMQTCVGCVSSS